MSENVNNVSEKATRSKFSPNSDKETSDAKISAGASGDLKQSRHFIQIEDEFKLRNGIMKLHNKNCKVARYRQRKFQCSSYKGRLYHQSCPHALKAKVCRTSPSLGPKSDLETTRNIKSPCKSDGLNCTVKSNSGWKLKKVFNKLRCFSHKIVSDSNFSQVKVWDKSSEKVCSSMSSRSCGSWCDQELQRRSSRMMDGTSSIATSTNQSSKSVNQGTNSSACTLVPKISKGSNKNVQSLLSVEGTQNSNSVETLRPPIPSNISQKSINSVKVKLRDKNESSSELLKLSKSCFEQLSRVKLKTLKSAPTLMKKLPFMSPSCVEVPSEKEDQTSSDQKIPKVSIVVDKVCQTSSLIADNTKVSTSTSCTFESCPAFSDKEIQNEISSFHAFSSSVDKMCQTESLESMLADANKGTQVCERTCGDITSRESMLADANKGTQVCERTCGDISSRGTSKETCEGTLSAVKQMAAKVADTSVKDHESIKKRFTKQDEEAASCEENSMSFRSISSDPDHPIRNSCCCSKNLQMIGEKLGWPEDEEMTEKIIRKYIADNKCAASDSCRHEKHEHALAVGGKFTCQRHFPKTSAIQKARSNPAQANHKVCSSVGYIQQPSILKSSSSFLKAEPLRKHPDCHTCNIHKNHEIWETNKSYCYDFPLTRSNFLKLYPEPYINHLSNTVSNVQLIFHKKDKHQKQLYVCQECKMNASWNRHTRKHRLSPKWRKSTSTCGSQTPYSAPDVYYSSADACSRISPESGSYRCSKSKQTQRKKTRRRNKPRQENSRSYENVGAKTSRLEMNPNHAGLSHGDDFRRTAIPSNLTVTDSQQTATDVFLPPPPPPLYEYPPYRYNAGEYVKTYPQGQRFRDNSRHKSPEFIESTMNEPIKGWQENLSGRPQKSPTLPHKQQLTSISSSKHVELSNSETSGMFIQPSNRRYVTEKAAIGFFNYNKSSNHLLKYPGFGDCIPSQPVKLSHKKNSAVAENKVRKKIKDKYRRDGGSVRCLIRDALMTERNNKYEKKNLVAEKLRNHDSKIPPKADSCTNMTTLYEKNQADFVSKTHRNTVKSSSYSKKLAKEQTSAGAFQSSKNTFCQLSDVFVTSESAMKVSAWINFDDKHRRIVKSESMQWPNNKNSAKAEIAKRFSEEFTSQRPTLHKKHPSTSKENDTYEIFRNKTVKMQSSSCHKLEAVEDLSTSDESLALYFRLMDVVAEKRQRFKKEERRKLKFQNPRLTDNVIEAANID